MATPQISTKHVAISKANAQMVGIVAAAVFVTIFSLVAANSVWSQARYQSKVVSAKEKANRQLKSNISAFNTLVGAYKGFDSAPLNVIGGNAAGTGDNDGTNSKIILDSLPSTYDFPALTSSLEKIVNDQGMNVSNITGTDDQVNQQGNLSSPTPQAVAIPFSLAIENVDYASVNKLVDALQRSIRPIQIDTLALSGGASNMKLTVDAHTYYQPGKSVNVTKKVIK